MTLQEINPFIRYANEQILFSNKNYVRAYDNRLFYIKEGNCIFSVNNLDFVLSENNLIYVSSGKKYRFKTEQKTVICPINFDYTQKKAGLLNFLAPVDEKDFKESKMMEQTFFSDCDILNHYFIIENGKNFESGIYHIINELKKNTIYYDAMASSVLKGIICEAVRYGIFEDSRMSQKIRKIFEYIDIHFAEDITNKQLGDLIGYHSYYVNRLMQDFAHITLKQYLINFRVSTAQDMLVKTNFSVQEISERCGFNSVYYFSRCFKKKTGTSPTAFRKSKKMLF